MRTPRIYTAQALQAGQLVRLEGSASRHLCQVLRLRGGDPLILFNGRGGEYRAELETADARACSVRLLEHDPNERESPLFIHLGLGLSKGDRFEWALQKATELGVSRITPMLTERTELRLDAARMEKKLTHWQRLIESSCEQCHRTRLPLLDASCEWQSWLGQASDVPSFILHPNSAGSRLTESNPPTTVRLAIGPEGGFSANEIEQALQAGFQPLALGPRVLRTESAPLAGISVLQWLWGDW